MFTRSETLTNIGRLLALFAIVDLLTIMDSFFHSAPLADPQSRRLLIFYLTSFIASAGLSFFLIQPLDYTRNLHAKVANLPLWLQLSLGIFFFTLLAELQLKVFSWGLRLTGGYMQGVIWVLGIILVPLLVPMTGLIQKLGVHPDSHLYLILNLGAGPTFYGLIGGIIGFIAQLTQRKSARNRPIY